MRKVTLPMKIQEQYTIIKRLAEGHIFKEYASIKIGCTIRHINRLLQKCQTWIGYNKLDRYFEGM